MAFVARRARAVKPDGDGVLTGSHLAQDHPAELGHIRFGRLSERSSESRRTRARGASAEGSIGALYPRGFWRGLALPGILWLLLLFVLPFYAAASTAGARLDPIFGSAVPEWNPMRWHPDAFSYVLQNLVLTNGPFRIVFIRTLIYVFSAVALCIVIGYPVAYYVSRLTGRQKALILGLVVLPFWISYLMRMLAWVGLLQTNGYVNRVLLFLHILNHPVEWLVGNPVTVVLGLVYGYVPFMILPLYAGLERIDRSVLEASWDLGAGSFSSFVRVTLPLSKQALLAGTVIIMLPMFGDYYTADLLSGRPRTSMIGSEIVLYLGNTLGSAQARGAALVLVVAAMVSVLTIYYLISTAKATATARTQ
jgi:spermidine/putrescine transport system permease protein